MDEYASQSLDTAETSVDIPDDIPDDISADLPDDIPEDLPEEDIPEDLPDDIPEDIPENGDSGDLSNSDTPDDIPEDVYSDAADAEDDREANDVPVDIPEDVNWDNGQSDGPADEADNAQPENTEDDLETHDITPDPFDSLSDYMNSHNYGAYDFSVYSQDPEWRILHREAFPDYELPPLEQENAYNRLSDYMSSHNYGADDFDTYSQDPIWQELHSAAFPDYKLPELADAGSLPNDEIPDETFNDTTDLQDFTNDADPDCLSETDLDQLRDTDLEQADQEGHFSDLDVDDLENTYDGVRDADEHPADEHGDSVSDNTDWDRTALRQSEEELLRDMGETGEIDIPQENPEFEDPEHSELHLPTEKTGEFSGERGNSEFSPHSEAARSRMHQYGRDTVSYKDGYPDFSPFTMHDSEWGEINGQVDIAHMTDQRENPGYELGRRPSGTGHDPNYDLGNFAQADNEIAEQLRSSYPEITGEDIASYRKSNHLVWHECADGKTMQLVPREIHDACRHSGGVSEMKYRMAWGDVTRPVDQTHRKP